MFQNALILNKKKRYFQHHHSNKLILKQLHQTQELLQELRHYIMSRVPETTCYC